jgi:flagellar hook-basal body complex protein FliE
MIGAVSLITGVNHAKALSTAAGSVGSGATHSLADFATHLSQSIKDGEQAAVAGINGSQPMQQVVEKVLEADRAVSTLVSIRDKAVGALLELTRMQV